MSRSLNRCTLLGVLGKDAEVKHTSGGSSVASMSVATERSWKDKQSGEWKKETDWHRITAWNVENLAQYLTKGQRIYVEGRLQTRSYESNGETKYVTEVIAENIILAGGGNSGSSDSGGQQRAAGPRQDQRGQPDDDIPF